MNPKARQANIINPCLPNETAGTLFSASKTAIWRSFGWARIINPCLSNGTAVSCSFGEARINNKMGFFKEAGLTKQGIRSKILLKLNSQKEEDREKKSRIIKEKLFRTLSFKKAKTVMFYISFAGEVNTQEMIKEARSLGKIIAVPASKEDRITIRPCIFKDKSELKKGPYGVCEPAMKRLINLEDIDLVIVPGIAFDRKGNRLGRGKGCYDRFLKKIPKGTPSIGLAFNFQILPVMPATATDVNVDRVIFA